MPEFDWVIEYETLPPDSPLLPPPEPPTPRRGPSSSLWVVLGAAAIVTGLVAYLWQLGARGDPLPGPDPNATSLEAIVELEINALNTDDNEIFSRVQDDPSRRRHIDPPAESWFGLEQSTASEVELVNLELVNEASAVATVKVTWNETVYRLVWFYRQVEGIWRHTDWQQLDVGQHERLNTSHFEITYHAAEAQQASELVPPLETFVADFCGLLPCPAEPLSVTLEMDTLHYVYRTAEIAPLHYRIPSPLRVRWPWDNQPEPVVLASIGRRLAYDLFLRDAEQGLPRENQVPLTLATFWLAHRLLDSESAPGTRWLDEAVFRDGLPAARAFIVSLADGVDPASALAASFGPGTAAAVASLPDYFGWLLFQEPTTILRFSPGYDTDFRWPRTILSQFDSGVVPWALDGRFYDHVLPQVTSVTFMDDWAVVMPVQNDQITGVHFFRQINGSWAPSPPDETTWGDVQSSATDSLTIYYYAWDEAFVSDLGRALDDAYQAIAADFHLTLDRPLVVAVHPSVVVPSLNLTVTADLVVQSSRPTGNSDAVIAQAVYELAGILLTERFQVDRIPGERLLLFLGGFLWELDRLDYGLETYLTLLNGPDWVDEWRPPASVTAPEWMPLQELWTSDPSEWEENEILSRLHYAVLMAEYMADNYGAEKVPLMMDTLPTATTMDEWSTAVTGHPLELLETDWRAWVIEHWASR